MSINYSELLQIHAAKAAADAELEACCEWLAEVVNPCVVSALRAARRPPAPSLKEQAIKALRERIDSPATGTTNREVMQQALRALEGGE